MVAFLALLLAGPARADGWPQPRGEGYYKLGYRVVYADQFYGPDGTRMAIPTLGTHTVSFYGEYGLTDRLTVRAYVPFVERITLNEQVGRNSGFVFFEGDAVTGLADPEVGARFGLWQNDRTVLSVGLLLGLPLGNDDQENGLLTGDGEFNQRLQLEAGRSFWPLPVYATASIGVNNRTQGFSDELTFGAEAGYTVRERVTLVGRLRGVASLDNGDDGVMGGMGGLGANNQRYLAYGAEVLVQAAGPVGLSLAAEGATWGQNVLAAPAFSAGVFVAL